MLPTADVVLDGGRVLTLAVNPPQAEAIALAGDSILAVGSSADLQPFISSKTRRVRCAGRTVLPGFIDPHLHLCALASRYCGTDVSGVRSFQELITSLRSGLSRVGPHDWLRGYGYDEFLLREKRHPTRRDLDAVSDSSPIILRHRTGHAAVLNSPALDRVGIDPEFTAPAGGTVVRQDGWLSGVLFELEGWLRLKIPPLPAPMFADGLARAGADLLRHGICAFHDASAGNMPADVDLFRRLRAETVLRSRPTVMVGIDAFSEVVDAELNSFCEADGVRLGHVKIMVHETAEGVHPSPTTLADDVWRVHRSGFHVAIHAVEEAAVCAAVDALEKAQRRLPRPDARHRIEHCALCPPPFVDWLAATRCGVVLQPGFLHAFGDKYAAEINSDVHGWLYRLRSLKRAGIAIAGSSDCPVGPLSPLVGIGAAMTRRSSSGVALNLDEALTLREALGLYTHAAAWMGFEDNRTGRLLPGWRADLVVVDADLTDLPASAVGSCAVGVCVVDGQIVWEA